MSFNEKSKCNAILSSLQVLWTVTKYILHYTKVIQLTLNKLMLGGMHISENMRK